MGGGGGGGGWGVLTSAAPEVWHQGVTAATAALVAALGVCAECLAATILDGALIDVWRETNRHPQTDRHADRHADRQTGRQTHRHTDRHTHRQTDTQTDTHTQTHTQAHLRSLSLLTTVPTVYRDTL